MFPTSKFWATTKVKTIDEEVQIHARVDGQKIIVTEASVREVTPQFLKTFKRWGM
jgi:hypothetical protein